MSRALTYDDLQPTIDKLLEDKESVDVEFKSARGGFPQSFWETYSSFANTNGGTIILGVKEHQGEFSLDDLTKEQVEKYRKDFFNMAHSKQKVNVCLLSSEDVQEVEFKGHLLLFFFVPHADYELRPVYVGQDPLSGTYRRAHEGDYLCTPIEVRMMFADADTAHPVDGRPLEHYDIKDLDMASIKQYRRLFQVHNPDHVWNGLDDMNFLRKLNVFRTDRKTGEEWLTLAGLLMFGTYSSLMDADPNFFPDYQERPGGESDKRWIDRICPDGNWESNLFQFYRRVLPVLQNFLPKPFQLRGNQRIDETSAHVAVREAFANFCVHANYLENATMTIYKYPNKIVFSNPGILLITPAQYYHGSESVCRNKYLQTMFTFLGDAEKAGSGVDKIMKGWKELDWKKPYLHEKSRPDKVELIMPMESLFDDATKAGLNHLYGDRLKTLDHNELHIIALAYSEEEISNDRLQYVLDMHHADITKMLTGLRDKGFLESFGYGRGTTYQLKGASSNMTTSKVIMTTSGSNMTTSRANMTTSGSNMTTSGAKITTSHSNVTTLDRNVATSDANVTTLANVISPIASKKRVKFTELKRAVLAYCSTWRTVDEITTYIGRKKTYIRQIILPKLQDDLEMYYPNIPNHPRQRYKAKDSDNNPTD